MPRVTILLDCKTEVLQELERLSRSRTDDARLVDRARIILACLSGKPNNEVAAECGTNSRAVGIWRKRFAAQGVAGLHNKTRPCKPSKYAAVEQGQCDRAKPEETSPAGPASWDSGFLAKELAVYDDAARRILRAEGIQPRRHRFGNVNIDPEFIAMSFDIIGLYLAPLQKALVLCVNKRPSAQMLEQTTGCVQAERRCKIVLGRWNTYKRPGTASLFAALNIASGMIQPKTATEKRREKKRSGFQSFLGEIVAIIPDERNIHVILDGHDTCKNNERWLAEHPTVHFHGTPSSASWFNQVGIWFEMLSRKAPSGESFVSAGQLVKAIESFMTRYNEIDSPFVWRKH